MNIIGEMTAAIGSLLLGLIEARHANCDSWRQIKFNQERILDSTKEKYCGCQFHYSVPVFK